MKDLKETIHGKESGAKLKTASDPNTISYNKPCEDLGNGRWKYQGKTYKEETIC